MAVVVQMPKLGATMERGTILEWLKDEGDSVEIGEPILEIMTDKINMEVEAVSQGVLLKKLYEADTEVPVLVPIAYIGEPGETILEEPIVQSKNETTVNKADEACESEKGTGQPDPQTFLTESKIRRTPVALKFAKSHGVDLRHVKGSGPNQRIQLMDVEMYFKKQSSIAITPLAEKMAIDQNVDIAAIQSGAKIQKDDVVTKIPSKLTNSINYNGIRKVVGERMAMSVNTAPHVTLHTEVDMTKAIEIRTALLETIKNKTGSRLSFTEIIIKSVAKALKAHPMVNASLNGNKIDLHDDVNIGLAVAIPNGLIVPVIRNADQKGLAELTKESKQLAKQARENRLGAEALSGGTFTISNLGMYAVDAFTPIINQPESAILGVGRIREQVVSINGSIEVRPQMALSLSFDHRVIDGAPAAHFLTDLREILENPYELMV